MQSLLYKTLRGWLVRIHSYILAGIQRMNNIIAKDIEDASRAFLTTHLSQELRQSIISNRLYGMSQIFNGRVPSRREPWDTNLVHHWRRRIPSRLDRYKHFFGTTAAMERPDRNLTSVLREVMLMLMLMGYFKSHKKQVKFALHSKRDVKR